MTTNFHTPLTPSDNVDAATMNAISSDLDSAISAISDSGTTFPVSPSEGDRFVRTDLKVTYEYHDSDWRPVAYEHALQIVIDGGGSAITSGEKYTGIYVPIDCTIQEVIVVSDVSGSIEIDLQVDTYANFPPDGSDSIVASAPPTLSSAQKSDDSTLTGWTTQLNAGDFIRVYVNSATTVTWVNLILIVHYDDGV